MHQSGGKAMGSVGRIAYNQSAGQDGRLVVLPCKAGDTVWFNAYTQNASVCLGVRPHKVIRFDISAVVPGEYTNTDLPLYMFGKSVFLTREEAVVALEAQKGESHETDSV